MKEQKTAADRARTRRDLSSRSGWKVSGERLLEALEACVVRGSPARALAQFMSRCVAPDGPEIDVRIGQFSGGDAKGARRAATPEMHAHHQLVLHRVDDERTGIRARYHCA